MLLEPISLIVLPKGLALLILQKLLLLLCVLMQVIEYSLIELLEFMTFPGLFKSHIRGYQDWLEHLKIWDSL